MSFKVVFIGAGARANQAIYPAFNALAEKNQLEIAAICEIDKDKLNATADKYGISRDFRYGGCGLYDYRDMIEDVKPDAVVAVGQPHIFYDIWKWCLEKGLNLYIEKPLGLTLHQARALTYLANRSGSITQVSFQRRSTPLVIRAREECLKRGAIFHSVCKFYKCERGPFIGARDHMMDDCIHSIDTVRWINGGEVTKISSVTRAIGTPDCNYFNIVLEFDNGSVGVIMNNWLSGKRIFAVEMHAPGIYVEAEHETEAKLFRDGSLIPEIITAEEAAGSSDYFVSTGVLAKVRDFVDACKRGRPAESDFNDALKTMEVAEKVLAQAVLGG
jgi:virulence factor